MILSRVEIGIDEITWLAGWRPVGVETATALPPAWWMAVTGDSISTLVPRASTFSRQRSHIIPGPYFGYWNSSMRLVISFWFRLGRMALVTAFISDRFLMRWAAQSAWISVAGTPHSFSV